MRTLIVAHPDDEILWFNPELFDKIFIVFLARHDKTQIAAAREAVIENHPYKERIELLKIPEPGYWKDPSRLPHLQTTIANLKSQLHVIKEKLEPDEIYTHNSIGEYGHTDHILVNYIVKTIFTQTVIWTPTKNLLKNTKLTQPQAMRQHRMNIRAFLKIRDLYIKHSAWTWKLDYLPDEEESYQQQNSLIELKPQHNYDN